MNQNVRKTMCFPNCVFVCGGGGDLQAHVIETVTVRLKIIAYCYTT